MPPPTEHAGADHPLDRIFQLGAADHRWALSLALAAALLAHGGMAGAIRLRADESLDATPLFVQEVSIEREVPPPPAPPPAPEPEVPPPPLPQPPKADPNVTAPAPDPEENPYDQPASEAAQAGEILAQEDDEQEADDDDDDDDDENTFVTGDAGTYAGGMTASGGTSTSAVHGSIVPDGGVPGGTGTLAVAPKPEPARDLSRGAWLEGNTSWDDCDFPGEANRDKIRDGVVGMTVTVRPNGTAVSVEILDDPGHGFARTATACALRHKFSPALDAEERRILGKTRAFRVGFHR